MVFQGAAAAGFEKGLITVAESDIKFGLTNLKGADYAPDLYEMLLLGCHHR